jgi:hypothetical protein
MAMVMSAMLPGVRAKLIRIGAKVARHGRYVAFQIAGVESPVDRRTAGIPNITN